MHFKWKLYNALHFAKYFHRLSFNMVIIMQIDLSILTSQMWRMGLREVKKLSVGPTVVQLLGSGRKPSSDGLLNVILPHIWLSFRTNCIVFSAV